MPSSAPVVAARPASRASDASDADAQQQLAVEEYVLALHDFTPSGNATCLAFKAGQVIRVLNRDASGWWDGELDGHRGWFPSNYTGSALPQFSEEQVPMRATTPGHSSKSSIGSSWSISVAGPSTKSPTAPSHYSVHSALDQVLSDPDAPPILQPLLQGVGLLKSAVSAQRPTHFQPSTACVISCVRTILVRADCLQRDTSTMQLHPLLGIERKRILDDLSALVAQTRACSIEPEFDSDNPDPSTGLDDDERDAQQSKMLTLALHVYLDVETFVEVAQKSGIVFPRRRTSASYSSDSDSPPARPTLSRQPSAVRVGSDAVRRKQRPPVVASASDDEVSVSDTSATPLMHRRTPRGTGLSLGTTSANTRFAGSTPSGPRRSNASSRTSSSLAHQSKDSYSSVSSSSSSVAAGSSGSGSGSAPSSAHSVSGTRSRTVPAGPCTPSDVLTHLRICHDDLLSTVAAFIGLVHSHVRPAPSSTKSQLIGIMTEAVDRVSNMLRIVDAVSTAGARGVRLRDSKEHLYVAVSALVDATKRLTIVGPSDGAEDADRGLALQCATATLKASNDCAAAVRMGILRGLGQDAVIVLPRERGNSGGEDNTVVRKAKSLRRLKEDDPSVLEDVTVQVDLTVHAAPASPPALVQRSESPVPTSVAPVATADLSAPEEDGSLGAVEPGTPVERSMPVPVEQPSVVEPNSIIEPTSVIEPSLPEESTPAEEPAPVDVRSEPGSPVRSAEDSAPAESSTIGDEDDYVRRDTESFLSSTRYSESLMSDIDEAQATEDDEPPATPSVDMNVDEKRRLPQLLIPTPEGPNSQPSGLPLSPNHATLEDKILHGNLPSVPFASHQSFASISTMSSTESNELVAPPPAAVPPAPGMEDTDARDVMYNAEGMLIGASLDAIVEHMTPHSRIVDPSFSSIFFSTFRMFTTPTGLVESLRARYNLRPPTDLTDVDAWRQMKQMPVRLRVTNLIKTWLEFQWRPSDRAALDALTRMLEEDLVPTLGRTAGRVGELISMRVGGRPLPGELGLHEPDSPVTPMLLMGGAPAPSTTAHALSDVPRPIVHKTLFASLREKKYTSVLPTDFDPLELARQLTVMENELYRQVKPEEVLGPDSGPGNVRKLSTMSTALTGWVADTILSEPDTKKRAGLLKFFIKVSDRCVSLNNFSASRAILAALDSSTISRLTQTWQGLHQKSRAQLEDLRKLADHARNFSQYRNRLKATQPPAVPFFGLYLTDMTFCRDGNPSHRSPPGDPSRRLINFNKYHKMTRIVQDMQRFQVPYALKSIPEIQAYLDFVLDNAKNSTDPAELYQRSLLVEPRQAADVAPQAESRQLFAGWASSLRGPPPTPAPSS